MELILSILLSDSLFASFEPKSFNCLGDLTIFLTDAMELVVEEVEGTIERRSAGCTGILEGSDCGDTITKAGNDDSIFEGSWICLILDSACSCGVSVSSD